MNLWRAALRSVQGRLVLAVILSYAGWQVFLTFMAPTKIAAGLSEGTGKVHVIVTLPFTPDRFHVIAMQRFGRVSGTDAQSIEVRGVSRADLPRLARPYWVSRVELYKGD